MTNQDVPKLRQRFLDDMLAARAEAAPAVSACRVTRILEAARIPHPRVRDQTFRRRPGDVVLQPGRERKTLRYERSSGPLPRSQRVFDKLRQVFDVAADLVALAPLQTRHPLLLVLESSAGSRDVGQGALDCLWKLRRFRPAMECPRDLRFGQRRILDNTNLERRTALTNRSWVSWIITGW